MGRDCDDRDKGMIRMGIWHTQTWSEEHHVKIRDELLGFGVEEPLARDDVSW